MRGRTLFGAAVAALAGAAVAVVPATGAGTTVVAHPDHTFRPATVTVHTGDTVTFRNAGGAHNVHFEDEIDAAFPPNQSNWEHKRTFTVEGVYRYFSDAYGDRGGNGMSGVVIVQRPPETLPPPKPAPPITEFAAVPLRDRFCNKFGRTCQRPGVIVRMQLPADATVVGTLERRTRRAGKLRFRTFGTLAFKLRKGRRSVTFRTSQEGDRLIPGLYRLRLAAGDERDFMRFTVRGS